MFEQNKLTIASWHELPDSEKEILRTWAVQHNFGLDIIPNTSGTFDPSCDYAALLTPEQMRIFLKEHSVNSDLDDVHLWDEIKKVLTKHPRHA